MTPEPLLAPFTDKGKEVSTGVVPGFDTGTNTETGGPFGDQRGSVLKPVPELCLAAQRCTPEELRPVRGSKDPLHSRRSPGLKPEAVGQVRGWGIAAPEEKPGGGGVRGGI